jgi:hypothetical protein
MAGVLAGEHFRLDVTTAYWLSWRWGRNWSQHSCLAVWRRAYCPDWADDCTLKDEIPTTSRSLRLG